tara:strand:+ start:281 stop:409 length:129 start_codon:yes stop_codon:yes gene_type:complete
MRGKVAEVLASVYKFDLPGVEETELRNGLVRRRLVIALLFER